MNKRSLLFVGTAALTLGLITGCNANEPDEDLQERDVPIEEQEERDDLRDDFEDEEGRMKDER